MTILIKTAMHFQGRKLRKGSLLRISSLNQLIEIYSSNIIGNGKVEVVYLHLEDSTDKYKKNHVYLDVLELMGLEWVEMPNSDEKE